ncbi:uroporphyrinogen-III synthase [Novosphingobium sp.]|uniref:uroporphyrinogen-III synthase n=1 Tax=Novosphingobium sp. TaxID=1874826 RepID=UPI0038BA113D
MPRPLLVLRPEPGAESTATAARALGLEPVVAPLFRIAPRRWACPDPAVYAGLLVGSANVVRHGGDGLAVLRGLPVHAVGEATAAAAQATGFAIGSVGSGGLQSVAADLAAGRYLRLAGEAHVPLATPANVTVDTLVIYAAQPLPLSPIAVEAVRAGAVILLHSGEAARYLDAEMHRLGVARESARIAALAPRIAALAGAGWHDVGIASQRSDDAVLALAAEMCQTV